MSTYYNEETGRYENYEKAVIGRMRKVAQVLQDASGQGISVVAGIRYDTAEQGLTSEQQANARTNIDAPSTSELSEEIAGKAVRYDAAQELSINQKQTARANINTAPDTLTDTVHALHKLLDYKPQTGQITGTNYATITRDGNVININGNHGGGIVTGRLVINGALAYANSNTAFAGLEHAGIRLTVGHQYALRLTHISGTAVRLTDAPNVICYPCVYANSTDSPPTSPSDGHSVLDPGGYHAAYIFTYDQALEPNGVLLAINIRRLSSGTPTFTNYRFAIVLEDITDGGAIQISGTTPAITALPGERYVCGECSTLDITLPASGCVDVVFKSGSTPTVLTVTPPTGVNVKWANDFDPTSLEADTTYEINIMDGLGVVGAWT
ncbi:MAG: hypothetical protein IKS31_01385 [Clostridia bacterium]|nr:hypothetical protein [Clostridia bacterium]